MSACERPVTRPPWQTRLHTLRRWQFLLLTPVIFATTHVQAFKHDAVGRIVLRCTRVSHRFVHAAYVPDDDSDRWLCVHSAERLRELLDAQSFEQAMAVIRRGD